jgi:hypothetical protein
MSEDNLYIPHSYDSRGAGVTIDPKSPNIARVYFDVDGRARYLFALSRRELERLARKIEHALKEMPLPRRPRKRTR